MRNIKTAGCFHPYEAPAGFAGSFEVSASQKANYLNLEKFDFNGAPSYEVKCLPNLVEMKLHRLKTDKAPVAEDIPNIILRVCESQLAARSQGLLLLYNGLSCLPVEWSWSRYHSQKRWGYHYRYVKYGRDTIFLIMSKMVSSPSIYITKHCTNGNESLWSSNTSSDESGHVQPICLTS